MSSMFVKYVILGFVFVCSNAGLAMDDEGTERVLSLEEIRQELVHYQRAMPNVIPSDDAESLRDSLREMQELAEGLKTLPVEKALEAETKFCTTLYPLFKKMIDSAFTNNDLQPKKTTCRDWSCVVS